MPSRRKKKNVSIEDTTAALLKEVEAMEAAKAADKPKPAKKAPAKKAPPKKAPPKKKQ